MSERDQGQERTEQPSQRRLDKARREGQVARSRELNTVAVILLGGSSYLLFGGWAIDRLAQVVDGGLARTADIVRDPATPLVLMSLIVGGVRDALVLLAPVFIGALIAVFASPLLLGGFALSGAAVRPKLSRLDPLAGLGRIFSLQGLMELVKTLLKFVVLTGLAAGLLWVLSGRIIGLGQVPVLDGIALSGELVRRAFLIVVSGLVLIAALDVPVAIFNHLKRLRMTRQEVRDEHKETEGSPEMRARVNRVRREMAGRRMMQAVPLADVVLTNPTHYAVALRYTDRPDRAPRVVAKGRDLIASHIREVAESHDVPVCESPLLTRAIYFNTELGADIPVGLYLAVARVLVWVTNLKTAQRAAKPPPAFPTDLPVPPELVTAPRGEV